MFVPGTLSSQARDAREPTHAEPVVACRSGWERMGEGGPDDSSSTLVQTGKAALTFSEMGAFVRDIEARPQARLLSDLDGLLALPDAKYQLVVMVLRRKLRGEASERDAILARVRELQAGAADPAVRTRAGAFLAKPQE